MAAATADQLSPQARPDRQELSLLRWVWRTYVRHALIPLLLVELLLVVVYLASHAFSLRKNVAVLSDAAREELALTTYDKTVILERQLGQVANLTDVLRRQAAAALLAPAPRTRDRSRLRLQPGGAMTTWFDDGGAAVHWSSRTKLGPAEFAKLERLATLDPLLEDVTLANPLIVQTYINTHDSLNRIWPWVDTASLYVPDVNVPDYNFYYEADARHDPARTVVWTDAYVDPAGKGWLVSAIAPVYRGDFLEGVVGADVTIDRIIADVLTQDLPWKGFLLLIGKSGTLLALPPQGEKLFSLKELKAHRYVDVIRADTFKPEEFNVFRSRSLSRIGALLRTGAEGSGRIEGEEPHFVAWRTIPSVGWKLMSLVPEEAVFGPSRALERDLASVGWILVAGLGAFYAVFFTYLYRRARFVSRSVAEPLAQIERMAHRMVAGETAHASPEFAVSEFRHTVEELKQVGRLLGETSRARQDAEARLTERNAELSTILSLSPDGLVSFDADGRVTETNPAFLAQTGWSHDALIGISHAAFWARLAELGNVGEPHPGETVTMRLLQPKPIVLECRVVGAESKARVAYFRDVTRAVELDRTKSRFVATAAHELRTPIAVITGYAEFLQASDPPPAQRGEILATMRRHGDQIAGIVTELLDLARIEARAGRDFTMVRQQFALAVRRFMDGLPVGPFARVPTLEGDVGDAEAFLDAGKFGQALMNVLVNACKYSPPDTPVTVRLVATPTEVGVSVADRGEGMDEQTKDRIFEAFYRAESAAVVAGTGLGMSIVKEIMDIHGGRIEIETLRGSGTSVSLWLPRAAARD